MRIHSVITVAVLLSLPALAVKDSCYECHLKLRGKLKAPSRLWANDVHRQSGMTCAICHKGDASVDDLAGAKTGQFVGSFPSGDITKLCGGCHGDWERVHKVNVKQAGSAGLPSTCIDCHSVHDIRKVSDPLSPAHARQDATRTTGP